MPRKTWRAPGACAIALVLPLALRGASAPVSKEVLTVDGREHAYFLFVPKIAPTPSGPPMLLLLHGSGHDGRSLLDPWKRMAAREGIVLVAPNALDPTRWQAPADGPEPLLAIAQAVGQKYHVDSHRIYLFGHSAGAVFALLMPIAKPEYFAAIAVHAGALLHGAETMLQEVSRKTPIQVQVGTEDRLFPLPEVRRTRDVFVAAGFPFELKEIPRHDHNYYVMADRVNRDAWAFLKDKALAGEAR